MQYSRQDRYMEDYEQQELSLRRRAQISAENEINRNERDRSYLLELLLNKNNGTGSISDNRRVYSPIPANAATRTLYDEYLETNGRGRSNDAVDNGPSAKRVRKWDELDGATVRSDDSSAINRQRYGHYSPSPVPAPKPLRDIVTTDMQIRPELEYSARQHADFDLDRFSSAKANIDYSRFMSADSGGRNIENQREKIEHIEPPTALLAHGHDSSYARRIGTESGERNGMFAEMEKAAKYCRDLYLAEEEESKRRKEAIQAEMEKIVAAARSAEYSSSHMHTEDDRHQHQHRSAVDFEQMQQRSAPQQHTSESMAAAELRSLMAAGRISSSTSANAANMITFSRNDRNVPVTTFDHGVDSYSYQMQMPSEIPVDDRYRWAYESYGHAAPGYGRDRRDTEFDGRQEMKIKPLITKTKTADEFFGGKGTIDDERHNQRSYTKLRIGEREISRQPRERERSSTIRRSAPINIPNRKLLSKREVEDLERRHHGAELRQLLGAPQNAEIWVETGTSESLKIKRQNLLINEQPRVIKYFYNAITGETMYNPPNNPTKEGQPVHILTQDDLVKMLSQVVPVTMILFTISNRLTEAMLRSHFEQFGGVAMTKKIKLKRRVGGRTIALVRMATIDGQKKALAVREYEFCERRTELLISQSSHRLFVSRLPGGFTSSDLQRFISDRANDVDAGLDDVIDAYLCTPFTQFGFVTFGGRLIVNSLLQAGDFLYKDRYYLNVSLPKIELDATATEVYTQRLDKYTEMMEEYKSTSMASTPEFRKLKKALNAFLSISELVKSALLFISQFRDREFWEGESHFLSSRAILSRLRTIFSRTTDEELRSYHDSQEFILEMCLDLANRLGYLADPAEFQAYTAAGISGKCEPGKDIGDYDGDGSDNEEQRNKSNEINFSPPKDDNGGQMKSNDQMITAGAANQMITAGNAYATLGLGLGRLASIIRD